MSASFAAIASGISKEMEIPIDDAQKPEVSKRFLAKNMSIVVGTDDFKLAQVTDSGHTYWESPAGEIDLKLSANVIVTVGIMDVGCIGQLPKS